MLPPSCPQSPTSPPGHLSTKAGGASLEQLWVLRNAEASPIPAQPYPTAAFLHLNERANGANPPLSAQLGHTMSENCQSHQKKNHPILGRDWRGANQGKAYEALQAQKENQTKALSPPPALLRCIHQQPGISSPVSKHSYHPAPLNEGN